MAMYTYLETQNLDGKTIYPFCTHEGSGLGNTANSIKKKYKTADGKAGLAVRGSTAQNDRATTKKTVTEWIKK